MPRVVSFHYTLRDPSGRVLDSSAGGQPVTYLEGAGMIIDGLDQRLRAVASGAKERVQVPFAEAYGARDPEQMQRVLRTDLPVEGELSIGDQFQTGPHRTDPGRLGPVRADPDPNRSRPAWQAWALLTHWSGPA